MRKALITAFMGVAMISANPWTLRADDHPKRYHDRDRNDDHEWNERESRAYRHWLTEERHRPYRDWDKASKREQRDYWRWRHEHSDWR